MRASHRAGAALAVSILLASTLTGCWDRREVNDIAIVSGTAMDKVSGKYRAAVQFPLAGQLGGPGGGGGGTTGSKSWYVDSGMGDTVREANGQLQRSLSRQLYFAHRRVLVLGEELAREGISPILDVTTRTPQNRMTAFIVVAKGEGIDILNADAVMEQQPAEMIRELTVNSMKRPRTVKHTLNILLADGIDLALPSLMMDKNKAGDKGESKTTLTLDGLAVFKKDKLAGFLKGDTAKGALWAMNQARRQSITIPAPKGEGSITMLFSENQVELNPAVQDEDVEMRIKIRAIGHVSENGSNFKASADNLHALQRAASDKLRGDVEKGIKELQQLGSDACGFGETLYRKKQGDWKRIKDKWREMYPQVKVTVVVELQLEHSGTLLEPAAKKKESLVQ